MTFISLHDHRPKKTVLQTLLCTAAFYAGVKVRVAKCKQTDRHLRPIRCFVSNHTNIALGDHLPRAGKMGHAKEGAVGTTERWILERVQLRGLRILIFHAKIDAEHHFKSSPASYLSRDDCILYMLMRYPLNVIQL